MARYFKFKSADELSTEATRLGAAIGVSRDVSCLAEPVSLAGRIVGNRVAIQPMEGCDADQGGAPGDLTLRRYRRFGSGGGKLIWGEAVAVSPAARANCRQLVITRANAPRFRAMLEGCRQAHREAFGRHDDLLVGMQLTHSGRFSLAAKVGIFDDPVVPNKADRILEDSELSRLVDDYARSAQLLAEAGADFVDIKQCHRYLLSELLAARRRPGKFGGSLTNRLQLVLAIIDSIRAVAPSLLIATRINAYDGVPFKKGADGVGEPVPLELPYGSGFGVDAGDPLVEDLAEPIAAIGILRAAGVAMVNISLGCPYFNPHILRPAEHPPIDGYLPPEHPLLGVDRHFRITRAISKAHPDLPIVGSGYSYLQEFALGAGACNVGAGDATFVGIGRAALAYPDLPADVLYRKTLKRNSLCRTFSYCTNLMRNKDHPLGQFPTGCPPFDKEVYGPIWKEARAGSQGESQKN